MSRLKVALFASDLSGNALGRAFAIGEMLARDADVRIAGPMPGDGIWPPCARGALPVRVTRTIHLGPRDADVIYAFKPLPASFGSALLHRRRRGTPVVLDVDDDELAFRTKRVPAALHPLGYYAIRAFVRRAHRADAITVASTGLQQTFGGTVIPHPRDTGRIRPQPELQDAVKARIGVAGRRVILFAGTPRAHKGVEDLAAAMRLLRNDAVLVVAGARADDPYVVSLKERHPAVHLFPEYPYEDAGLIVQAADVVAIPHRNTAAAIHQTPAKLLDAMAAGKPIVATTVGEIPQILETRGMVVPPQDPAALAAAIDQLLDDRAEAERLGRAAREWCVRHASYDALRGKVLALLHEVVERRP